MKCLKWIAGALVVLVALLALVPLFVSLDDYAPRIEAAVSEALGEPVKIGSLRAAGLPLPHATITGLSVGRSGDIRVGQVKITPDLASLLDETRVIRSVEIERLEVTREAIERIASRSEDAEPSPGPPAVRVERIEARAAVFRMGRTALGPFDIALRLNEAGHPVAATLKSADGKLAVELTSTGEHYRVRARAQDWVLPVGMPLRFEKLDVQGTATPQSAEFSEIQAALYGGTVSGRAAVDWEEGMRIEGTAQVAGLQIAPLLKALQRPARLSGRLDAKPVQFSAAAEAPGALAEALRLETPFDIQDGVLQGVDIGKAATSLVGGEERSRGETRFDTLSGHFLLDRGTRRISRIRVASGSLSADGHVVISRDDELKGRINANVRAASVTAATIPLNLSGTLESPRLLPTRGTMAGAAVGTAILGPGVGTTIGSKIGQWTESLFGGSDEESK